MHRGLSCTVREAAGSGSSGYAYRSPDVPPKRAERVDHDGATHGGRTGRCHVSPVRQADRLDGPWRTTGYGTIVSIDGGRLTSYTTTSVSCGPGDLCRGRVGRQEAGGTVQFDGGVPELAVTPAGGRSRGCTGSVATATSGASRNCPPPAPRPHPVIRRRLYWRWRDVHPDIRTPVLTDEELANGLDSALDQAIVLLSH